MNTLWFLAYLRWRRTLPTLAECFSRGNGGFRKARPLIADTSPRASKRMPGSGAIANPATQTRMRKLKGCYARLARSASCFEIMEWIRS